MKRGFASGLALAFIAVLFVAINVFANLSITGWRADLTGDRLFTLSNGTRAVLQGIDEPITLRFYYSERLGREIPSYGVYAQRVREMLQEYRAAAPAGRFRLEVIDPQPFTDEEDRAVAFGLQGVPLNQTGEQIYFGLAGTNSADREEVLPFFQPERERFLEYDLTRLIYNLSVARKPPIGLMSSVPLWGEFRGMRQPAQPSAAYTQLTQFFEVRRLENTVTEIPADLNVLVLVHPKDLPDQALYAIDQFVMRGGRLVVFVDPHSEFDAQRAGPMGGMGGNTASNLERLFHAWGFEMVPDRIAGDRQAGVMVQAGPQADTRQRAVQYIAWLQLRDANFNRQDVLTADLGSIRMGAAGILRPREGATTTFTPLIQTGTTSMEIEADSIRMMPDPAGLLARFQSAERRLTVAARITGPVRTAFPDGPPPPAPPAPPAQQQGQTPPPPPPPAAPANPAAQIRESRAPANLIVIADSDMLDDRFWVQAQEFFGQRVFTPTANNGDLLVNAVDNLQGSDALISLRARGQSTRPFARVDEMRADAEQRFRATERQLTERLREAEQRLTQLRTQGGEQGSRTIITPEQQATIEQFRGQIVQIRRELRNVQSQLRADIANLETVLKVINIGLLPLLIALFAIIIGLMRMRRRRISRHGHVEPHDAAHGARA